MTLQTSLTSYAAPPGDGLIATLAARAAQDPFNVVATAIFILAIAHTFSAAWFASLSRDVQHRHDVRCREEGRETGAGSKLPSDPCLLIPDP